MRQSFGLFAGLLAGFLFAGGCSDLAEPRVSQVAGIYALDAGGAVQLQVDPRSPTTYTVTGARLDLTPFWTFIIQYQTPESSLGFVGEYSQNAAGGIILDYESGSTDTGTFNGDRLTITRSDGTTIVFRKIPEA